MIKIPFDVTKNKTQMMVFALLVVVIIAVLFINFLLIPQVARLTDVFSKMGKMRSDLKSATDDIAKIEKFHKDIDSYKGKVERYEKMLPAEQEIPTLLENLSEMAKSSNIKILGITPAVQNMDQKAQKNGIYQEIPILISAKSGYHELGLFLSNLENSDRFMKVVDIEIKANKTSPKKHDIELIVLTYILLKGK